MATSALAPKLHGTDGYVVESPDGRVGWVEEVWLGETNEPRALAVRTADGRHGLLLDDQVLAVDREYHWVVVPPEPTLLELDVPRLVTGDAGAGLTASWATTGQRFRASPPHHRIHPVLRRVVRTLRAERPLWQTVSIFLGSIVLVVAFTIAIAFIVARVVTGDAY